MDKAFLAVYLWHNSIVCSSCLLDKDVTVITMATMFMGVQAPNNR